MSTVKEQIEEDEIPCTICGDPGDYETDVFMFCDECDIGFHQSCYGLQNEKIVDDENEQFFCHYCLEKRSININKIKKINKCSLCGMDRNNLAITTIDCNDNESGLKWCHVVCVYAFKCKSKKGNKKKILQKIKIDSKNVDKKYNKNGKCIDCKKSIGYKLECRHPKCSTKIHPSCARIKLNKNPNNSSFYFDDVYQKELWRDPIFFCSNHNVPKNNKKDAIQNKESPALKRMKQWDIQYAKTKSTKLKNGHKANPKKRKRATDNHTNIERENEPMSKRRKLTQKVIQDNDEDDTDDSISSSFTPPQNWDSNHLISTSPSHSSNGNGYSSPKRNGNGILTANILERHNEIHSLNDHFKMENDKTIVIIENSSDSQNSLNLMASDDDSHVDSEFNDKSKSTDHKQKDEDPSSIPLYNDNTKRVYKVEKPTISQLANVHDFEYCMDKCYCIKCLDKDIMIKTEEKEIKTEKEENKDIKIDKTWFNDSYYFEANYKFEEMNDDYKQKLVTKSCQNINIGINNSPKWNKNENNKINESYNLKGYQGVAIYNYDDAPTDIPSDDKSNNKSSLFYRKIYRDIMINCGGSVICMDFCPINKYYNKNPYNYLSIFADPYNKYHKPSNDYPINGDHIYIIQIWKLKKKLKIKKKSKSPKTGWNKAPDTHKNILFHYGVKHQGGLIWDMKWLPFRVEYKAPISLNHKQDKPYQRMGILACSSDDKCIYIYSLPFVAKDSILMDINPVIKLSVTKEKFFHISWSTNLMYPMLIASTINGAVAIWDFKQITSKINENEKKSVDIIDQQLNVVACHSRNEIVTGIDWCSDHLKYFITVSQNGCLRLWDINNLYTPIFTRNINAFSTDLKWIPGMDASLITSESYLSDNNDNNTKSHRSSTDCCTRIASIWPQQFLEHIDNAKVKEEDDDDATPTYSRMGSILQFPAEKLFHISDKVAYSMDVLLKCNNCQYHDQNGDENENKLVSNSNVELYVLVGYSSGNVILYQHKLDELADVNKKRNGQILSQLVFKQDDDNKQNECCFLGPFYGIDSNINQNECNEKEDRKVIFDPYHLHPTELALNDNIAVRKVKICPNNSYLEICQGSISGIIRIQTVDS